MSGLDPNAGGALVVPGGGTSLPTATGAGQILRSTGAGEDYAAVDQGDVVGDALDSIGPSGLRAALDVYSTSEVDAAVAAVTPTPILLTSANATVTDASPGTNGSSAIDSDGIITLVAEDALAGGFAAGPKISLAFTGDAGSRFRARVRLVSKSGPSSDSLLALYFNGVAGLAIYARISGQIGVWDLGAGVPATASVTALWNGTEYLEIRMMDGLVHFGVWQGTTYTTVYLTTTTVRPTTVGVMLGHVAGGATQTVVLDAFTITDLRAW